MTLSKSCVVLTMEPALQANDRPSFQRQRFSVVVITPRLVGGATRMLF
jgi:hypothetical protein